MALRTNIVGWPRSTSLTRMLVRHPCRFRDQHLSRLVQELRAPWSCPTEHAPADAFSLRLRNPAPSCPFSTMSIAKRIFIFDHFSRSALCTESNDENSQRKRQRGSPRLTLRSMKQRN